LPLTSETEQIAHDITTAVRIKYPCLYSLRWNFGLDHLASKNIA